MQRPRSSRAGSTFIELLVLTGLIAVMIALLIPVVLNRGDDSPTQKFANKTAQKHPVSQHSPLAPTKGTANWKSPRLRSAAPIHHDVIGNSAYLSSEREGHFAQRGLVSIRTAKL